MTRLHGGVLLSRLWPAMAEPARLKLLRRLGELTVEVHTLPVDAAVAALAPPWEAFIAGQRQRPASRASSAPVCRRPYSPSDWAFLDVGPVPAGAPVLLTGEYTPMNLFAQPTGELAAMFDFGDGLAGPREYDWLGPLAFLAASGASARRRSWQAWAWRSPGRCASDCCASLLLHRYSHLPLRN
ncbi:MAG: phosphotransferase [Rubrivivax sp.]